MKIFITGGTGFIGSHVVRKLRERGDEVRALVRTPEKGEPLAALGAELVSGSLADEAAIRAGMEGCDAVIHGAAIYELGIPAKRREAMYETNVLGTERVLRAALDAGIPKVIYTSSIVALGDTGGRVVDETYEHPGTSFTSYYEETKYKAHQIAQRMIDDEGLPCVLIQPVGVYGPDDHSQLGNLIGQYIAGKLPLIPFPDFGVGVVHVEDVADGILLALDKADPGEAYILGGALTTNRELLQTAAKVAGKERSARGMPTAILKGIAPFGPVAGPVMGFPPNMRELVRSSDGVTFWGKHDKAIADLGYSPRGLEATLRDTLVAEGRIPA
jgi:dihydroflavonol-4-reductase